MKLYLSLLIKGFFLGIAKILPGVSGSLLAISLNVYYLGINSLSNLGKNPKKNIPIVFFLGSGVMLAIVIFSKIVYFFLQKYYIFIIIFFLGLVGGGYNTILNKVKYNKKNIVIFIMSLSISVIILLLNKIDLISHFKSTEFIFFLGGILEAIGSLVPGISSSFFLMILGIYDIMLYFLSHIDNIIFIYNNMNIIIAFLLGMFLGIVILSKVLNVIFSKYSESMYSAILAIYISNFIYIIYEVLKKLSLSINLIGAIMLFVLGFSLSFYIDKKI